MKKLVTYALEGNACPFDFLEFSLDLCSEEVALDGQGAVRCAKTRDKLKELIFCKSYILQRDALRLITRGSLDIAYSLVRSNVVELDNFCRGIRILQEVCCCRIAYGELR